jgi:phosphate transport system substrate-binding protein
MSTFHSSFFKISSFLGAFLASSSAIALAGTQSTLFAQAQAPPSFPVPAAVPNGTALKLDGSPSMTTTNKALKQGFEQKFSGAIVDLAATGTDEALEALLDGKIDLAAVGRPLTQEEKAQGLVEVPIGSEKIAIIVGAKNPFKKNLTFAQFAKMFRGEITDWSEVGGKRGPIRFIDRPVSSDTRIALGKYSVFQTAPFQAGVTAAPVTQDDTATVIKELGKDGIGYAIVSQVLNQPKVTVLSMHQTLPDDPRYPYSQPRSYVYKDNPSPAAQAFLGYMASPDGQAIAGQSKLVEAAAVAGATGAAIKEAASPGSASPRVSPSPQTATAPEVAPSQDVAVAPPVAGTVATDAVTGEGQNHLSWLPWLFLPLAGGFLWWIAKGRQRRGEPEMLPPVSGGVAGSTLHGKFETAVAPAFPVAAPVQPPAGAAAGLGAAVVGTGLAGAAIAESKAWNSYLNLVPKSHEEADAIWTLAIDHKANLKQQGGQKPMLRLYDVTDIDFDRQPAHTVRQFDCEESASNLRVPIPSSDRDYVAELGYVTNDGHWLKAVRSHTVRIHSHPVGNGLGTALAGGAALAAGAALVSLPASKITLSPRSSTEAHAEWTVPAICQETAKAAGGKDYQLRIYDATEVDLDKEAAHSVQDYPCGESEIDKIVPIPMSDLDYVAEIGYATNDHRWLMLARSSPMRVPAISPAGAVTGMTAMGTAIASASGVSLTLAQQEDPDENCAIASLRVHGQANCFLLTPEDMQRLQNETAVTHTLTPGTYLIRIKEGGFGWRSHAQQASEPTLLLWMYGGRVINQKTNVPVSATWSTLNGFADALNLEVLEQATLCAFFFDTYIDDNEGELTLSIIQL